MNELQEENGSDYLPPNLCLEICISGFEEVLEQLTILSKMYSWPDLDQINVTYKTVKERFSESAVQTTERQMNNVLIFKNKCAFITAVFKTAVEELRENGSYNELLNIINVFKMTKYDEEKLKEDTLRKQAELKKFQNIFQEDTQFYHRKIEECMADTGKIKDEIEDFKIVSEIKLNYVRKWDNSKIEMNETLLSKNEQEKMDKIKKIDTDIYKEVRVHQEILAAFQQMQQDLEFEIDRWKIKYNNDLTELDKKINQLKEEQGKQEDKTRKLKEVYSNRQKQIDSFKEYKIKQQEMKLDMEQRSKAVTKIQAWWRGTMVLKGFGKFRKKKDKKGKKRVLN
ncbi:hypothetical protein NQ314_006516 [Rhamnusium bicolor]|uniref:Dynein regulatory complex protein 9 n=1 Tax=Rhamnusium bicolor TaxID=1586634 RepID=A0AAV8Z3E7_9CUCU|nr:hypothetical protein NQ314_006516 [Rhamnusium bicolor]